MIPRRRSLLIAQESTAGTPVALGTAALPVHAVQSTPQTPYIDREPATGGGRAASITGARSRQVSFGLHLTGKSGGPSWAPLLLPVLGFVLDDDEWHPTSIPPGGGAGSAKTATVGHNEDGRLHTVAGCAGTARITGTAGGLLEAQVTLTGKDLGASSVAMPTVTYPSGETLLRCAPMTLTIGGNAMALAEFSIDLGNSVTLRESGDDATGYIAAQVVDRAIKGSFIIEAKPIAGSYTPHSQHFAGTVQVATLIIGAGATAIVIMIPEMQIEQVPGVDRSGSLYDQWSFVGTRGATENDLVIAFGV